MIHFLGKVHLEYAEAKPLGNNINVNPSQYIRIVDRGLADIVDVATEELNIFNVRNVEEAVDKFGTFNKFVDFLLDRAQEDRVIVYCDEVAMVKMLCGLWKSLFPSITPAMAQSFLLSYRDAEHLKIDDSNEYINIDLNSERLAKSEFIDKYWTFDSLIFEKTLTDAPSFDLSGKETLVGLEYILMKKRLSNGSFDSIYSQKMDFLYKKNFMKEILFMGSMIKEHYMYFLDSDPNVSVGPRSVYDSLKVRPELSILFDSNVGFSSKSYDYVKQNYDLPAVLSVLKNVCEVIHKRINPDFVTIDEFLFENPITEYILRTGKEPSLDQIMDQDPMNIKNYHLLRGFVHMGTLNQYLLQGFYLTLKRTPEELDCLK